MSYSLLESSNTKISEMCCDSSWEFTDNRDGLHLVEHGEWDLARNFIYDLIFLDTCHYHPNIHIHTATH